MQYFINNHQCVENVIPMLKKQTKASITILDGSQHSYLSLTLEDKPSQELLSAPGTYTALQELGPFGNSTTVHAKTQINMYFIATADKF